MQVVSLHIKSSVPSSFTYLGFCQSVRSFPGGTVVKNPLANAREAGDMDLIPGQKDPLEEKIATHSSILAWEIPWTGGPAGLQSMRSQRIGYD